MMKTKLMRLKPPPVKRLLRFKVLGILVAVVVMVEMLTSLEDFMGSETVGFIFIVEVHCLPLEQRAPETLLTLPLQQVSFVGLHSLSWTQAKTLDGEKKQKTKKRRRGTMGRNILCE